MNTYPVYDPGRPNDVVFDAPCSSPAEVDAAVQSALDASREWAEVPLDERIALVIAAANAAVAAAVASDWATLLTRENGKALIESQFELATIGAVAETFGALAPDALAPRSVPNGGEITAEPYGVVAALLPFNWPAAVLMTKVAPTLIAGNTIVIKPPPTCPAVALMVAEAMAGLLPAGVLNSVSGPGVDVGQQLLAHRDVAMISVTGGAATGRAVLRAAAERLVPTLLELGGNDAAIVAPDVEVDGALAAQLLDAAFVTGGQVCMALKRLYVPNDKLAAFVDALIGRAAPTVTGYGLDDGVTIGAVHSRAAADRAEAMIAQAEFAGSTVHRVGEFRIGSGEGDGYFVHPAVVVAPAPDAAVVTDEQFAPVLPVLGYDDLDDAVAAANNTQFGLGASVWSGDAEVADALARRLHAGTVFRNGHGPAALDPALPFGGWKESGIGREYGADGVRAYTRSRSLPPPGRLFL